MRLWYVCYRESGTKAKIMKPVESKVIAIDVASHLIARGIKDVEVGSMLGNEPAIDRAGIEHIVRDGAWEEAADEIRALIPQ
jgi:hypothetical protein